jgi:hypothetical protein
MENESEQLWDERPPYVFKHIIQTNVSFDLKIIIIKYETMSFRGNLKKKKSFISSKLTVLYENGVV